MLGIRQLGEHLTEPLPVGIEQEKFSQIILFDGGSGRLFCRKERFHASSDFHFAVAKMTVQVLYNPNEGLEPIKILLCRPTRILSHGPQPLLGFNESARWVLPALV